MQRPMIFQIVAALLVVCISSASSVDVSDAGSILPELQFYHRFSQQLKERKPDWSYLTVNTPEYHQVIVQRDLVRHGRTLATTQSTRTFLFGNITVQSVAGLQYATIDIGSPMVSHLVALDTGSDLFWLPCECKACAPVGAPAFQGLPSLNVYTPSTSNTSKEVTCGSNECSAAFSTCQSLKVPTTGQCTYEAAYGSPNTTTSGTMFQDVIHLRDNRGASNPITTEVLFGCGQTQTGNLVDGTSVPDGLIGLGRQSFSVPSTLAASGIVGNSFSVCFNFDGSGRFVFGDFGSPTQSSTPFLSSTDKAEESYFVGLDAITVGNESITVGEATLFDTGTTVTFLQTAVYKAVLASFAKQIVSYQRTEFQDNMFDLCYTASSLQPQDIPVVAFELSGGASFPVLVPIFQYLFTTNNSLAGFCLALLDGGTDTNIFSVSFMAGYNLVFNREQLTLGFNQSDCYSTVTSSSGFPAVSPGSASSPSRVPSPSLRPAKSPVLAPSSSSPRTLGPSRAPSAAPRTSVSLLAILSAGLLVNFVLH